jgi:hypothetical protein
MENEDYTHELEEEEAKGLMMASIQCMVWLCYEHKTNQRKFRQLRALDSVRSLVKLFKHIHNDLMGDYSETLRGVLILMKRKRLFLKKDRRKWRRLKKNKYKRHVHGAPWWKRTRLTPDKYAEFGEHHSLF